MYKLYDKLILKWIVKYEKDLGITKNCIKKIKQKSTKFYVNRKKLRRRQYNPC
jgi:hypothetical protein